FARELMELFTLGIGQYTETDVLAAARAFTGWSHDGETFVLNRRQHDAGLKTFLGQTSNFGGDDILSLILGQPACARFVAEKLFGFLAYPADDAPLADALGQVLWDSHYDLRPLL